MALEITGSARFAQAFQGAFVVVGGGGPKRTGSLGS